MRSAARLAAACAVAAPMLVAAAPVPAQGLVDPPVAATDAFDAVREGLAAEMLLSAEALEAGERHRATMALDRARGLARFAATAYALPDVAAGPFQQADQAVRDGRHALQNGRPEDAARILAHGAAELAAASFGTYPGEPIPDDVRGDLDGVEVLDTAGNRVGELEGFASDGGQTVAAISVGGWFGIGDDTVTVPADALLASPDAVVIAGPLPAGIRRD